MERVSFKSLPHIYEKEEDGRKPNTLRMTGTDERFKTLASWSRTGKYGEIEIVNSDTGFGFVRQVTDVTFWHGWTIISWSK